MPSHVPHQTEGRAPTKSYVESDQLARPRTPPRREQILRLAEAVATGAAPFPTTIGDDEFTSLLAEVRRIRRERLLALIARAIAQDIRASWAESSNSNAQEKL